MLKEIYKEILKRVETNGDNYNPMVEYNIYLDSVESFDFWNSASKLDRKEIEHRWSISGDKSISCEFFGVTFHIVFNCSDQRWNEELEKALKEWPLSMIKKIFPK